MDVDTEKENTQASLEIYGWLAASSLPFHGEILPDAAFVVECYDVYVYSFFIFHFKATYSMSTKIPSDDKKIRCQQLVDLCACFKLTFSGNMGSLRVGLRSFSDNQVLWGRRVNLSSFSLKPNWLI